MSIHADLDSTLLIQEVPYLMMIEDQGWDWDELGAALNLHVQGRGPFASAGSKKELLGLQLKPKDYWTSVKSEIFALLCTKSAKYASIRERLATTKGVATIYILTTISVWLAEHFGAQVGMITPLVATVLYAVSKVGVSAWCELSKQEKV